MIIYLIYQEWTRSDDGLHTHTHTHTYAQYALA